MIYITGDIHGSIDIKKLDFEQIDGRSLTNDDYLIITGDFGFPFFTTDTIDFPLSNRSLCDARDSYLYWINWLSEKPYNILWIDGNHDNHPYWDKTDTVEWNGGKINRHPLAHNVIHLKRGEYFEIDGKTFWTMGGAMSHDRNRRIEGFTWWREEVPSMREMQHGTDVLDMHGNSVDFILSHAMPNDMIPIVLGRHFPDADPTSMYFNEIYRRTKFRYWFCGHYHSDVRNDICRIQVLYNNIVCLDDYLTTVKNIRTRNF